MIKFILITLLISYTTTQASEFDKVSKDLNLPENLLKSICKVESGLLPYAHNPTDAKNGAFGICQLLPSTAWQYGIKKDLRCINNKWKRYDKERNTSNNCILFNSEENTTAAGKFLKKLFTIYGKYGINAVIASYNAGSPKICKGHWIYSLSTNKRLKYSPKKCKNNNNKFMNQLYVDKVNKVYKGQHK